MNLISPVRYQQAVRRFEQTDQLMTGWMAQHGVQLLRVSLGIVFVWFGALKLFPDVSLAEGLVRDTLPFLPMALFLPFLAIWEIAIGLGFITGKLPRVTILLLMLQMPGTLSPLILNPDAVWTTFPFALTLEGQYIVKNLVLISGALVIGATVRGGRLLSAPPGANSTTTD